MGLFFLTPCFLRMPVSPKIVCFRFLKKFKKVKLCLGGKLQYKPIKDVEFTLACNGNANCIHVTRLDIKLGCVPRQNCKCFHLYNSGCSWYDQVICDGEVVRDLYRWWFQSRCSNSRWTWGETSSSSCNHIHPCLTKSILRIHTLFLRMSVISRSWSEVRSDPRFRP